MRRSIFGEEHDLFRAQFRRFAEAEIQPRIADWNARGVTDRETWRRVGEQGFLGLTAPEEYGGAGADYTYAVIIHEELARIRAHALSTEKENDVVEERMDFWEKLRAENPVAAERLKGQLVEYAKLFPRTMCDVTLKDLQAILKEIQS